MIRKPDPPVLVAVTKEPPGKLKTSAIQILDYNLNRFDINDRKGLEIVMLTSLFTFHDLNDNSTDLAQPSSPPVPAVGSGPPPLYRSGSTESPNAASQSAMLSNIPAASSSSTSPTIPHLPPKPHIPQNTGLDRVAEMHAIRGDVNEITVEDEGSVEDYAAYAAGLLEDEAMLFITIQSAESRNVGKVLRVVEDVKRRRHKLSKSLSPISLVFFCSLLRL